MKPKKIKPVRAWAWMSTDPGVGLYCQCAWTRADLLDCFDRDDGYPVRVEIRVHPKRRKARRVKR